jgi:hypothetical protein
MKEKVLHTPDKMYENKHDSAKSYTSKILVFFVKGEEKPPVYTITVGKLSLRNSIFSAILTLILRGKGLMF